MREDDDQWKRRTIQSYEDNAASLAEKYNRLGARRDDVQRVISLADGDEPLVVELGCGNGRDAQVFLKYTDDYVGVDVSENLVALARRHVSEGRFVVEDIENYVFPEGVDCVVAFASLLHLSRNGVKDVLRRAHDALSANGLVYVSVKQADYNPDGDTVVDEFGERTFFYYQPDVILDLAEGFDKEFLSQQEYNGNEWFTVALRKH